MTTVLELRDRILADLSAALPAGVTVRRLRGSNPQLHRESVRAPAVMVYVGGARDTGATGAHPWADWLLGAVVIAGDTVGLDVDDGPGRRDDGAMLLVERVLRTVVDSDWGGTASRVADNVRATRIREDEYERRGLALWAVTWEQRLYIEPAESSDLAAFLRLRTQVDLAGDDQTTRSEQASLDVHCDRAAVVDGSSVTVAGVMLTARAAPVGPVEFALGATDADLAAALAAAANAQASLADIVRAEQTGGTVTLRAVLAGAAGNAITVATSGPGFTAAAPTLTGGVDYPMEARVDLEGTEP